jgi:hypothetical protein
MGCLLALCLAVPGGMPESRSRIRVVDAATGAPVANATVMKFVPLSRWHDLTRRMSVSTTDASGLTTADLPANHPFEVEAPGYEISQVARCWFRWKLTSGPKEPWPANLDADVIVIPLERSNPSPSGN